MAPTSNISLRTTQRTPRSCISCASRKVRCDKAVPCSTCILRGEAEACAREVVIVRGAVRVYEDKPTIPTYGELSRVNERLREEISSLQHANGQQSTPVKGTCQRSSEQKPGLKLPTFVRTLDHDEERLEDELWGNLSASSASKASTVSSWDDVVLPSRKCSKDLVAYDKKWNSWVHYAVEYPRFQEECSHFMDQLDSSVLLESIDPLWLAVYFAILSAALLMMDDEEAEKLPLSEGMHHRTICETWYHTAIFCLHRGDFMRKSSTHSVQAIAILGMSFNNWGDSELGQHMRSCAVRIAQSLRLNTPYSSAAEPCLSREGQHRLWWTLVICEWLDFPHRPPAVDAIDFDVPLPTLEPCDDEAEAPHPVHYHAFMARTATVVYRFRAIIRSKSTNMKKIVQAVRMADEELAEVIDTLPAHLQPDNGDSEDLHQLELSHPWVKWQRFDLTVVLLHLRVRINQTLQVQWLRSPEEYEWARTVSIDSAKTVIWINSNWDQPASMRKQWALSYHIFTSAILLIRETRVAKADDAIKYISDVQTALHLLDKVKAQNALAYHAAQIIRNNINNLV